MTEPVRRVIVRGRMPDFLGSLDRATDGAACSLYLPPALSPAEREAGMREVHAPHDSIDESIEIAGRSPTGAVLFSLPERTCLVLPPFPVGELHRTGFIDTDPLKSLLGRDYTIALVLVRLGSFAVGVCRGEKLLGSKVGTGNIHGRHKKGGSSAHRFERHRDKQIEYFLTRVCRHSREHIEPHLPELDYLVYGGARTTIQLLQKQCEFIARIVTPTLPPLYDIPEPRQPVLETAIGRVWSSTVIEWEY